MEKIILSGMFNGHSVKKDGLAEIKFKFVSDELVNCLGVFRFIGKPIAMALRIEKETLEFGQVLLSGFATDKDGRVTIKFKGESELLDATMLHLVVNKQIRVRLQDV